MKRLFYCEAYFPTVIVMIISKFVRLEQGYIILGFDFMHIMKRDR